MFKDSPEGQTHSENDGCGEPAHNKMTNIDKYIEEFRQEWTDAFGRPEEGDYIYLPHKYRPLKEFLSHALQTYGEEMKKEAFEEWMKEYGGLGEAIEKAKADGEAQGIRRCADKVKGLVPEEKNGIVGIKGDSSGVHYTDIQSAEIGEWNAAVREIKDRFKALDALNNLTQPKQ